MAKASWVARDPTEVAYIRAQGAGPMSERLPEEASFPGAWRAGNRYRNPHVNDSRRRLWHVLLWQLGYYDEVAPIITVPEDFVFPNPTDELDPSHPKVTWINHTTFLVEMEGKAILTDPIWSDRCSPFRFIGPKRLRKPGVTMGDLPSVDFVLISHDHYDHLDRRTVKALHRLFPEVTWLLPKGVGRLLRKWGVSRFIELDWWQSHEVKEIEFTAVPAQHFSGRSPFDRDATLWCGWVVRSAQKRFYFAGDTGYNPLDFKRIGEQFGSFDLSLIPIGAYLPRAFMNPVHASPEDAVNIHLDTRSRLSIGSHWGTFSLSSEALHQPPYDLYLTLLEKGLSPDTFRAVEPGEPLNW